ncbi:hypothetical protein ACQEVB_10020 [Pseudonocardia sp. CA-107938]|uniref:hypothetical protein n=1 Tax=Pseudonocardia sp. CA-107938 TaxID=3240021 RepID=UPI003D8A37C0
MSAPPTIAEVLGPTGDALRDRGFARRALPGLVAAVGAIAEARIAEVLQQQLSIGVGDALVAGLSTAGALAQAARRTRDAPGPPEDVVLAERSFPRTYEPVVDVLVDGQVVATLEFTVELALTVRAAEAVVDAGRLTALKIGALVAGATLSLQGWVLATPQARVFDGVVVPLGTGVPLTSSATPSPAPWWQRT